MALDKDGLDAVIKKAKIGSRTAKKLHEANGTAEPSTAEPTSRQSGGTGSSITEKPDFGEL